MSKPISYNSEFLPEITIAVVFSDSPQYKKLIPFFEEYGYGFLVPNKNLVVIDGENIIDNFDSDVLKFIEAHEIAHIILGHDGPRNDEEELDADLGAYILLKNKNKMEPIKHLIDNFEDRHGIEFDEKLLKRVENQF
jgi:Zn-dependent peptidase ImmA (M78 family)